MYAAVALGRNIHRCKFEKVNLFIYREIGEGALLIQLTQAAT